MNTAQLEQRGTKGLGRFLSAIAACVMLVSLALPNAQAADLETTTAFSPPTIFFPGMTESIGNSFDGADFGKSFLDHYTFTLGADGLAVGSVITVSIDIPTVGNFSLNPFNAALYTGSGTFLSLASTIVDSGGVKQVLSASLLAAGDYDFRVGGLVAGVDGGSYGGTLQVTTPVPEPEIYAMLGLGLGLMGWVARRRMQQTA